MTVCYVTAEMMLRMLGRVPDVTSLGSDVVDGFSSSSSISSNSRGEAV